MKEKVPSIRSYNVQSLCLKCLFIIISIFCIKNALYNTNTYANSDDHKTSMFLEQFTKSWYDHSNLLKEHIQNIYSKLDENAIDNDPLFVALIEARNINEFNSMKSSDIYVAEFNTLLHIFSIFDKYDLHFVYYYYGFTKSFYCKIFKTSDKSSVLYDCDYYQRTWSIIAALEKYSIISTTPLMSYLNNTLTPEAQNYTKVSMIIDTRQNSQTIINESLKMKLWHSYSIIDNFIDKLYNDYKLNNITYFTHLEFENILNVVADTFQLSDQYCYNNDISCNNNNNNKNNNTSNNANNNINNNNNNNNNNNTSNNANNINNNNCHNDKSIAVSYQESEYYITQSMLFPSSDYWITISDIVILRSSVKQNIITELNNITVTSQSSSIIIFIETPLLIEYVGILTTLQYSFIIITNSNFPYAMPYYKYPISDVDESTEIIIKINQLLNYSKLIKWYTKNAAIIHNKLKPLPLGTKFQYNSEIVFGEPKQPIIDLLSKNCLIPYENIINQTLKINLLYFNFDIKTTDSPYYSLHTNIRQTIYDTLINNNFSYVENSPFEQYLSVLSTYRFCMAPPGVGIDTHRTWECLMVGTIPILIHSPIDSMFDDLPVLFVDKEEIQHITVEYLNQKYIEIMSRKDEYNFNKLYTPYWKDQILSNI